MAKILVTGGAGYIGSHVVALLLEQGHEVVVVDDLSTGHREAVGTASLVEADFADRDTLAGLMARGDVEGIVHLAAFAEVGRSVVDPGAYYRNNLVKTLALIESAIEFGVERLVFSSTCAVYGVPKELPLTEEHACRPINPYGETKLSVERALHWFCGAHGLSSISLRYFNAAGAHPNGAIGEDHQPESHLIPRLLLQRLQAGEPIPLFGNDYPTSDGTCVRDYVHVCDLARAHLLALDRMRGRDPVADAFNLGIGEGFSVQEVVDAVGRVTGEAPRTTLAPRRPGDPPILVAGSYRARDELGWQPRYTTIDSIVESAWVWHREHPAGYAVAGESTGLP